MRLTILGGGGFRVPLVYRALLADTSARGVDQVRLYDTDPVRVRGIAQVLSAQAAGRADAPEVVVCTELDEALTGADFVFSACSGTTEPGRPRSSRSWSGSCGPIPEPSGWAAPPAGP